MIRVHLGEREFELSTGSARALRDSLDLELTFASMRFEAEMQAMFDREAAKRLRAEWREYERYWEGEEEPTRPSAPILANPPRERPKRGQRLCTKCGLHQQNPASATSSCEHEYP